MVGIHQLIKTPLSQYYKIKKVEIEVKISKKSWYLFKNTVNIQNSIKVKQKLFFDL